MKGPLVSIVINCYNSERFLDRALKSIYSQTYKNWEIIFWDNLSTDSSSNIAKSYDDKLKYYKATKNTNLGIARKKAIELAKGDYLAFLDCDDEWMPEKLEKQVNALERNKNYDFSYTGVHYINEYNKIILKYLPKAISGDVLSYQLNKYEIGIQSVLIRNNIDMNFNQNLQFSPDYDLLMNIASKYRAYVIREYLIKYRVVSGSLTNQKIHLWWSEMKYTLDFIFEKNPNLINYLPFNRIKIRLKKEIVSLGKGKIIKKNSKSNFIKPSEWDDLIIQKDIVLIDLRNTYEIKIGRFRNSINPLTNNFSQFPKRFKEMKFKKDKKIAMYCTGGIRCEKASNYLSQEGYKNIFQLKGGIINYLDYANKNSKCTNWKGECFVFDNRVTINKKLMPGKYVQCHGCRTPITKKETMSEMYIKGVSCPHCYNKRSDIQKKSSMSRQKQINLAEIKNTQHSFSRITKL